MRQIISCQIILLPERSSAGHRARLIRVGTVADPTSEHSYLRSREVFTVMPAQAGNQSLSAHRRRSKPKAFLDSRPHLHGGRLFTGMTCLCLSVWVCLGEAICEDGSVTDYSTENPVYFST